MAKSKVQQSSAASTADIHDKSLLKVSDNGTDKQQLFEETAFTGLRHRIEQKLKDESAAKQKQRSKGNDKQKISQGKGDKAAHKPAPEPTPSKSKGQKRDRNGDVIINEDKSTEKKKELGSEGRSEEDILRREIFALGGTKEDFDLLMGIDSESEVEGLTLKRSSRKSDEDSLRKGLSKMLALAGDIVPGDLEEEEESEIEDRAKQQGEGDGRPLKDISDAEEDASPIATTTEEPFMKSKKGKSKESLTSEPEKIIPKEYSKLIVPSRPDWYATPLTPIATSTSTPAQAKTLPRHLLDRVYGYASSLLERDSKMYLEAQQASSSKFYSTIMSSGTLSDKISALTLSVQESPLHNLKALENLIGLGRKRSRTQAVEVLRSLKDMFAQGTLLPSDRRLKSFSNQPSLPPAFQGSGSKWSEGSPLPNGLTERHLVVWAFEHRLKEQYFEILKILEIWCSDEIEFSRSRAVSYVFELLKEKPEQEANLLRLLVNKLGDPGKKVASRASYLLLQLEQAHPMMKPTIIRAIEELIFRPGQSQHAKYYGIITLNQTILSGKEEKVAIQLLDAYFSLFVTLLKSDGKSQKTRRHPKPGKTRSRGPKKNDEAKGQAQAEEMQEKLISGILAGVNRAYPFTSSDTERLSGHIDTLYRVTHSSNFNTSIQAMMLIQQLTSSDQASAERFYRTLYESLLDPRISMSSKQTLYLNLLYKALKNDLNERRVKAFIKRIVQVLGLHQPSFTCGMLYLIRELEKTFTGIQSLFDQPEDNDSDEEVFQDVADEDEDRNESKDSEHKAHKLSSSYDPRKRDPEHSNADRACLWELLPYLTHYHPSVSVNASYLLQHQPMSGAPDLSLHTLIHFLDRFIYRTSKASPAARGTSIMQPLAGSDVRDRLTIVGKDRQLVPLNSEEFWKKKSDEVAAEDVFFHEYFNRLGRDREKAQKGKRKGKDPVERDEEGAEGISDDESEIWKALVNSRPGLEGDMDSDDDLDLDGLDSGSGSDVEGDESDGGVILRSSEGSVRSDDEVPESRRAANGKKVHDSEKGPDEEGYFDIDLSDEDAFVGSDEDIQMAFGEDEPEDGEEPKQKKKRKLKHLPTFASVDDYAALLEDEDEGV